MLRAMGLSLRSTAFSLALVFLGLTAKSTAGTRTVGGILKDDGLGDGWGRPVFQHLFLSLSPFWTMGAFPGMSVNTHVPGRGRGSAKGDRRH